MSDVERDIARIRHRTQFMYAVAIVSGFVVVVIDWLTIDEPAVINYAIAISLTCILFGLFIALISGYAQIDRLLAFGVVTIASILLIDLGWHLFTTPLSHGLVDHANRDMWGLAVMMVAAFALLGADLGQRISLTILATTIILTLASMWNEVFTQPRELFQLFRPIGLLVVLIALTSAATAGRDRLQRALIHAQLLEELANTDPLTGLSNRRAAMETISREVQRSERYGTMVSLVLVDLDHFKDINDQYGHTAGDRVLVEVGQLLVDTVRETDEVARWGGEEFLIIAPQTALEQAERLAERCRRQLHQGRPGGYTISGSFGVAQFQPGETIDRLLSRVDRRLYDAKANGRNQVVVDTPSTHL